MPLLLFRRVCACPAQTCWFGFQIHFRCFFNEVCQHLLQVFLSVGHDPEVVSPHKTAYLMLSSSFSFYIQENSFSFLHPFFLHIRPNLRCHLRPQARCFHASLPQTSIEHEAAFHTFKCGLARQPRHLTQEGCNDPSMCILIVHDLGHMLRLCLIAGRLDIQACQVHRQSYHRSVSHHRIPFFLSRFSFLSLFISLFSSPSLSISPSLSLCVCLRVMLSCVGVVLLL